MNWVRAIEIGATVLGDFERRRFIFARDAEDEIVEAVRPDFPGEIGERAFASVEIANADGGFARARRNRGDKLAAVVVDAQKIEWSAAEFHVAGFDAHEVERIIAREGFGIFAVKSRVDEPDVAERVGTVGSPSIGFARRSWFAVGHAEGGAHLEFRVDGLDGPEGLALCDVDDVSSAHALGEIAARGSVNSPAVAEKREDPWLVENAPVRDTVTQGADGEVHVIGKTSG